MADVSARRLWWAEPLRRLPLPCLPRSMRSKPRRHTRPHMCTARAHSCRLLDGRPQFWGTAPPPGSGSTRGTSTANFTPRCRDRTEGYDASKADVWSAGILLFTLTSGLRPFQFRPDDDDKIVMLRATQQRHVDGLFAQLARVGASPELVDLLRGMLCIDPGARLPMLEACVRHLRCPAPAHCMHVWEWGDFVTPRGHSHARQPPCNDSRYAAMHPSRSLAAPVPPLRMLSAVAHVRPCAISSGHQTRMEPEAQPGHHRPCGRSAGGHQRRCHASAEAAAAVLGLAPCCGGAGRRGGAARLGGGAREGHFRHAWMESTVSLPGRQAGVCTATTRAAPGSTRGGRPVP